MPSIKGAAFRAVQVVENVFVRENECERYRRRSLFLTQKGGVKSVGNVLKTCAFQFFSISPIDSRSR
jgi:hypothetical protein